MTTTQATRTEQASADCRPAVLVLCERAAPLAELLAVAGAMARDGRLRPVVVIANEALEERLDVDALGGMETARLYGAARGDSGGEAKTPDGRGAPSRLRVLGRRLIPGWAAEAVRLGVRWSRYRRRARPLFGRFEPVALLVSDDRNLQHEPVFMRLAEQRGCLTVVVPFAASDADADAYVRRGRRELIIDDSPPWSARRITARLLPKQVRETPYGRMLFVSPTTTWALFFHRMLPAMPWCVGGGRSDVVALFSAGEREAKERMGVPREKLVVTGQPSLDELEAAARAAPRVRAQLARAHGFDRDRSIIACAVPIYGEHGLLPWAEHEDEIAWLFEALAGTGAVVLLSLHPKSDLRRYRRLAGEHGLVLMSAPLRRWLPAADLFVGGGYSSTVRWAALLGIATVVTDNVGLGYSMYDDLDGLVLARTRPDFEAEVQRLLADPEARREHGERLRSNESIRGALDGGASRRIIDAILERSSS